MYLIRFFLLYKNEQISINNYYYYCLPKFNMLLLKRDKFVIVISYSKIFILFSLYNIIINRYKYIRDISIIFLS